MAQPQNIITRKVRSSTYEFSGDPLQFIAKSIEDIYDLLKCLTNVTGVCKGDKRIGRNSILKNNGENFPKLTKDIIPRFLKLYKVSQV